MVDIQSATAEIRRGKKRNSKIEETTGQKSASAMQGSINSDYGVDLNIFSNNKHNFTTRVILDTVVDDNHSPWFLPMYHKILLL